MLQVFDGRSCSGFRSSSLGKAPGLKVLPGAKCSIAQVPFCKERWASTPAFTEMASLLETWARALGAWGYLGLALAALIEYIFPPFPGDTMVVLGGAWAKRGERSLVLAHLALTLGSMVGIALTWFLGRSLTGKIEAAPQGSHILGLQVEHIHKAQEIMRKRGNWFLLGNRFLPSFRSVLFIAAGASQISLARTLLLGTLSAVTFNALLLGVGMTVGDNAEAISEFFWNFRKATIAAVVAIVALLLARHFWKKKRAIG